MSWNLVKLSDVCQINIGKTPSRANPDYWGLGMPWLSIADMNQGLLLQETKEEITTKAIKESNIKIVPKGTVLFSFKLSIGKIGVAQRDLYTNEAIAALPIKDEKKIITEYLIYALSQIDASKTTDRAVMGATLNKAKLEELEIPLPPLEEQKRIAAILDKADAIRRKRQQAIKLADEFLRAVFLDMFGDPITNPKDWEMFTLGEIATFENGDRSSKYPSGDDIVKNGVLFLSTKNIVADSLDLNSVKFITEEKFNSLTQGKAQKGDLLITLRGTLGSCCIFDCIYKVAFINAQMMIIRPDPVVRGIYLHDLLTSQSIKSHLQTLGHGAAVPQLTAKQLKEIRLPLPSMNIQIKYEEIRNTTLALTEKMAMSTSNLLFDSISKNAFKC